MALENRDLKAGQKLLARYKRQDHTILVLAGENGDLAFELDNTTIYKSLSTAGNAVTGGSVNGWRFWSLEGELKPKRDAEAKSADSRFSNVARTNGGKETEYQRYRPRTPVLVPRPPWRGTSA